MVSPEQFFAQNTIFKFGLACVNVAPSIVSCSYFLI